MLHRSTVESNTLELLEELMSLKDLAKFALVGGTALALQIGHRQSIDLDFFGNESIEAFETYMSMNVHYQPTKVLNKTPRILTMLVRSIKVDVVDYPYPWLDPWIYEEGIRMAGLKDIAAMKVNAITGRGSRKDFVDLFFLLKTFSLDEMIEFFIAKYSSGSKFLALKSLVYFEDADLDEMPHMFEKVSWGEMKAAIRKAHSGLV